MYRQYSFAYITGELGVDAFDVRVSAVIPELHVRGPGQPEAYRPCHLPKGVYQLFNLTSSAPRVEDGPAVQGNLTVIDTEMWKLRLRG